MCAVPTAHVAGLPPAAGYKGAVSAEVAKRHYGSIKVNAVILGGRCRETGQHLLHGSHGKTVNDRRSTRDAGVSHRIVGRFESCRSLSPVVGG